MRSPSHELVDALNSDVPRQALIDIISATNFNMDDSGGHMDDSGQLCLVIRVQVTSTKLQDR